MRRFRPSQSLNDSRVFMFLSVVSGSFVAPFSASLFPKMFGFVLFCQDQIPAT